MPIRPLKPIEALVRHRECNGFGTINELELLVKAAMQQHIRVVLGGPETSSIHLFPPAVQFLIEYGFTLDVEDPTDQPLTDTNKTARQDVYLASPLADDDAASDSPKKDGTPEVRARRMAARALFQSSLMRAFEQLNFARYANSSALTVHLHHITLPQPHRSQHRIEVRVSWKDELGHPTSKSYFCSRLYSLEAPTMHSEPSDGADIGAPLGAGSPTEVVVDIKEDIHTVCDVPCEISVLLHKRRMVGEKLRAKGTIAFDNRSCATEEVLLNEADKGGSEAPVATVLLEVESIALRVNRAEGDTTPPPQGSKAAKENATAAAGSTSTRRTNDTSATKWVEHRTAAPRDKGVKYDADDYFAPVKS